MCADDDESVCVDLISCTKHVLAFWSFGQAVQDRADAAFRTYERMLLMDVQPNRHTYWAVLYACARSGNADVAETVVDQLAAAAGGPVHRSFYTQLAQAYVTADRLEDAFKVIKTLEVRFSTTRKLQKIVLQQPLPPPLHIIRVHAPALLVRSPAVTSLWTYK